MPELWGECGDFSVPERAWLLLLSLAQWYGWRPSGTLPPDEDYVPLEEWQTDVPEWDGRYFPDYCQRITEQDAEQLAQALERALADIPDHDALPAFATSENNAMVERPPSDLTPCSWFHSASSTASVTALQAFSGRQDKATLRNFIAHAREHGGLWIC